MIHPHPLHLIDKYSRNKKAARWLTIQFKTQYFDTQFNETEVVDLQNSIDYQIFNGYLKYSRYSYNGYRLQMLMTLVLI